jgi:hypothetical protein
MKYLYRFVPHDQTIEIPVSVALCPDCQTRLTISPTAWEQHESGWVATEWDTWCESEPDDLGDGYDDFLDSHPSFEMPYVYWLPIDETIRVWLNKTHRFTGLDE